MLFKRIMFLHQNIHKYTWTSSDGKIHNQIDHKYTQCMIFQEG